MCQSMDRNKKQQGMNWISQVKRLAIYARDGFACAYCGASVEDEVKLTLDHLLPHSLGGTNKETNLITCCNRCNSIRGNRPLASFIQGVVSYLNHGIDAADIHNHIEECLLRPLDIVSAKELIARRGSCFNVLQSRKLQ